MRRLFTATTMTTTTTMTASAEEAPSLLRGQGLDPCGTTKGKVQRQRRRRRRTQMVIIHPLLVLITCCCSCSSPGASPGLVVATTAASASASTACFARPWGVDDVAAAARGGGFDTLAHLPPLAPHHTVRPSPGGRGSPLLLTPPERAGWRGRGRKPSLARRRLVLLGEGTGGPNNAKEGDAVDGEWNSELLDGLDRRDQPADGRREDPERRDRRRRLVLVRHGCTYMNEYLSTPGTRWGDPTFRDDWSFRDSPLSERGRLQAEMLCRRISSSSAATDADVDRGVDGEEDEGGEDEELEELREALDDVSLVAVSPLTRALQTFELALLPNLHDDDAVDGEGGEVPAVVALPIAAERVYLSSDIGTPVEQLKASYPNIDFESEFGDDKWSKTDEDDRWWGSWEYDEAVDGAAVDGSYKEGEEEEWRPHGQGQTYVCRGEPDHAFHDRMVRLHDWLNTTTSRRKYEEGGTVALVAHWGVLQWLCGHDFANCEARVVDVDLDLRPEGFALGDEREEELFAAGESSVVGVAVDADVDVDVGDESLVS